MRFRPQLIAAVIVAGLGVAGLSWGATRPAHHGAAISVTAAYVRQPASPDVVAAYLTLRNTGDRPDVLTSVRTDAGGQAMTMADTAAGAMTMSQVRIPAHGTVTLHPGGHHIMIERPTSQLRPGDHVRLTLHFQSGRTVEVTAPVIGITAPPPH